MEAFISHNRADKEAAREIAIFLAADDVAVWFDEWEVAEGDSIVGKIDDALGRCTHFLILWSKNAAKSQWVRREVSAALQRAIDSGLPRVVPVLLDNTPIPTILADLKHMRYRGGSEEDRRSLITAITGHGPSSAFIRAVVKKYHEIIRSTSREDTFGLAACPDCGSDRIESWTDWLVDQQADWSYSAVEVPGVKCRECGWQAHEDEIPNRPPVT